MIELIERAARNDADRPAVITDSRSVTYPQLLAAARAAAAELRRREITRFGVLDQDAITVAALLAGAASSGSEAAIYPPLESPAEIATFAARFDHDVLLTPREDVLGEALAPGHLLDAAPGEELPAPPARPLLVFTTGTTGEPRGARQDWNRVLRPFLRTRPSPDERWLLAYGLHQFGGLQLLLHVLAAGATLVAPSPRRPREGLAAMRRHGVEHASGTPTFWRFLLAELHADGGPVPRLVQITLGGEAVPSRVLDDLRGTFPRARISQIYAANESGALRSVRDGRNGLPASALDDDPEADVAVRIVDGELWVRSRIGMLGYYGEPPIDPDAWRPTGDLVELVGDRILFRGRRSEIINVGGVKVHPLPVEERVGRVRDVALARVFGRPSPVVGAIVAVEAVLQPDADQDAVRAAIRDACADLPEAARPRSIRFVDTIDTTGSKLTRSGGR